MVGINSYYLFLQLRLLQTELSVEEVIREKTTKLFTEKCRSYYKPEILWRLRIKAFTCWCISSVYNINSCWYMGLFLQQQLILKPMFFPYLPLIFLLFKALNCTVIVMLPGAFCFVPPLHKKKLNILLLLKSVNATLWEFMWNEQKICYYLTNIKHVSLSCQVYYKLMSNTVKPLQ